MTTLSVVMTVFNGSIFLRDAIQSVLTQTYSDFEFLIVNDGSTDDSLNIVEELSRKDSRIRVIDQENRGLPIALNRAIKESKGDLIARMDADDVALPDRFEKQLAAIDKHALTLVGSGVYKISQTGANDGKRIYPAQHAEISAILPMRNCICHPTVVFRRDAFLSVGGYDANYQNCQDYDLWLRLIDQGRFCNLREPLLKYRRHNSRISAKDNKAKQTTYSVCAALNYFNRRKGLKELTPDTVSTEISQNIAELLRLTDDTYSRDCIIRHATRYARNSLLDKKSRIKLKRISLENASFYQKIKWNFYEKIA